MNQINKYDKTSTVSNAKIKSCFRCGGDDHLANDDKCRAKDAECGKCKRIGHCTKYCRSSDAKQEERKVKAAQQTCQDTNEYHHKYVHFASKEWDLYL